MGERRGTHRDLVGKAEGKTALGRWKDNIYMNFRKLENGLD
jgi:hypothetical protein